LANRLAMGEPASVSHFVRRFKLEKRDLDPEFKFVLSRFKT